MCGRYNTRGLRLGGRIWGEPYEGSRVVPEPTVPELRTDAFEGRMLLMALFIPVAKDVVLPPAIVLEQIEPGVIVIELLRLAWDAMVRGRPFMPFVVPSGPTPLGADPAGFDDPSSKCRR